MLFARFAPHALPNLVQATVIFSALAVVLLDIVAFGLMQAFDPESPLRRRWAIISIFDACLIVAILRLFVPGKDVFSWEGTYEFVAHFLLGILVALAVVSPQRRWYIAFFVLLTLWEGFMFWKQGHQVTGWTW